MIIDGTHLQHIVFCSDELRQDYRKLQQDNLQLKRERQGLLEKVARLEKRLSQRASKMSASEV